MQLSLLTNPKYSLKPLLDESFTLAEVKSSYKLTKKPKLKIGNSQDLYLI